MRQRLFFILVLGVLVASIFSLLVIAEENAVGVAGINSTENSTSVGNASADSTANGTAGMPQNGPSSPATSPASEESLLEEEPAAVIEAPAPPAPNVTCNTTLCNTSCIHCSDNACHEPSFVCTEELAIEKILPTTMLLGVGQVNILVRNTGNVALSMIQAHITGDGITTLERIPIEKLAAGDKDYTFVKINATKDGEVDIVLKLYINKTLQKKSIEQLTITKEEKAVTEVPKTDVEQLTQQLEVLKEKYRDLEQEYQNKKMEDYPVDTVYDKLKSVHNYLVEAQSTFFEEDYRKTKTSLRIVEEDLGTIEELLKSAKKKEVPFADKMRNNATLIGAIAAAIVSSFTVFGLIKSHTNKQKLEGLTRIIPGRKNGETPAEGKAESAPEPKPVPPAEDAPKPVPLPSETVAELSSTSNKKTKATPGKKKGVKKRKTKAASKGKVDAFTATAAMEEAQDASGTE